MNVNDLICVGAEPIALVDYILCREADAGDLAQSARACARAPSRRASRFPAASSRRSETSVSGSTWSASAIGVVELDAIVTRRPDRAGRRA